MLEISRAAAFIEMVNSLSKQKSKSKSFLDLHGLVLNIAVEGKAVISDLMIKETGNKLKTSRDSSLAFIIA